MKIQQQIHLSECAFFHSACGEKWSVFEESKRERALDATLRYAVQLEMMIKTLIDVLTRSLFAHVVFYENILRSDEHRLFGVGEVDFLKTRGKGTITKIISCTLGLQLKQIHLLEQ